MLEWLRMTASLLCAALLLNGCGGVDAPLPLGERISNCAELIASIRQGLREHARTIEISFSYGSDIYDELNSVVELWVEAALEETGNPDEGDYIRYQYGGYSWESSYTVADGRWQYAVTLTPKYYDYLFQERQAAAAAEQVLDDCAFNPWTTDYDKIRKLYSYICRSVRYDSVHRKNPHSHLKSTAYAALVLHTATCQGYCVALYRLLRASGVECRIITGSAAGEDGLHAWVIAKLDGVYFALDPTWDAGKKEWFWFLVSGEDLADHVPQEQFLTEDFLRRYPMAAESYRKEGER